MRNWFGSNEKWRGRGRRALVPLLLLGLLGGCALDGGPWASLDEVTPAFLVTRDAAEPAVASDGRGTVALTWVAGDARGRDVWLAISRDGGATFGAPARINPRSRSVWSDPEGRPIPFFAPEGQLLIAWGEQRQDDTAAVDLVARASGDGGRTLGPPVVMNDDFEDQRTSFHGRPAFSLLPDGAIFAVWTDTRERRRYWDEEGADGTSLFYATSGDGGWTWSDNRSVTDHACTCCRASAVSGAGGLVAVSYRMDSDEHGGTALAISRDEGTNFPTDELIAPDDEADACPASGPALASRGEGGGLIAWSTGSEPDATEKPAVWLAPWFRDGRPGAQRAIVDSLHTAQHPHMAVLGRGTLLAVEGRPRADTTRRVIALRSSADDGAMTPWVFLGADADQAWVAATGPRTALVIWRERGEDGGRIRLVRVTRR